MMNEGTVVPNREACRARMMERMQADEQGKARQEAHDRKKKEKQHEAAEGEGQDDGQVQAPSMMSEPARLRATHNWKLREERPRTYLKIRHKPLSQRAVARRLKRSLCLLRAARGLEP